jgi:hypothetical protein
LSWLDLLILLECHGVYGHLYGVSHGVSGHLIAAFELVAHGLLVCLAGGKRTPMFLSSAF